MKVLYKFDIENQQPYKSNEEIFAEADRITEEEANRQGWVNAHAKLDALGSAQGKMWYYFVVIGEDLEEGHSN